MDVSLAVNLDIQAFSGSQITDYNSGLTNCTLLEKGVITRNGKSYPRLIVTQRASIDVLEDSDLIAALNDRARGIYYWEKNAKRYIIHDNDVYETTQDSTRIAENSGTFSTGSERCTIVESTGTTDYLIILDAENNKGWVMDSSKTLDQIVSNFPSTLAHGGLTLDGYTLVMDEDGVIYNSTLNDPTTFPATGFITAERERDKGVYLGRHHDNAVAGGTRTTEFLYDAGNSTGSPLSRRADISYNIGWADGLAVWEDGDVIYFLGSNPSGQLAVYRLENFGIKEVENDTLASYLTQGITQDDLRVVFSGLSSSSHRTLLITIYVLSGASPGTISPKMTISYDEEADQWGFWTTNINNHTLFPLMAWTKRTGGQNATARARTGEGILHNGDIVAINDKLVPEDTLLSTGIYVDGIYEDDIFAETESATSNIPLIVRTGLQDGGTSAYKFQSKETVTAKPTNNTQTLTIKHSDEGNNSFDSGNTVDMSDDRKEAFQGGRFMRRNYQLEYSGDEQAYLENLDVEVSAGQ